MVYQKAVIDRDKYLDAFKEKVNKIKEDNVGRRLRGEPEEYVPTVEEDLDGVVLEWDILDARVTGRYFHFNEIERDKWDFAFHRGRYADMDPDNAPYPLNQLNNAIIN